MNWIIFVIIFIIALSLFLLRAVKGPSYTFETIKDPIEALLVRGYSNGFLVIDLRATKYFLQFRRYVKPTGDYGIELCFPNAKWSKDFFTSVILFCKTNNLIFSISEQENNKDTLVFLFVDFGQDVEKAHSCVKSIFTEIMGASENATLYARLENARLK